MPERHDNTKPATSGTCTLGPDGKYMYFPIEDPGYLKPFWALCIHECPDGDLKAVIDMRMMTFDYDCE